MALLVGFVLDQQITVQKAFEFVFRFNRGLRPRPADGQRAWTGHRRIARGGAINAPSSA